MHSGGELQISLVPLFKVLLYTIPFIWLSASFVLQYISFSFSSFSNYYDQHLLIHVTYLAHPSSLFSSVARPILPGILVIATTHLVVQPIVFENSKIHWTRLRLLRLFFSASFDDSLTSLPAAHFYQIFLFPFRSAPLAQSAF